MKSKSISKTLESSGCSWHIGTRENEFNVFEVLLDNRNGVPEFGKEEAHKYLLEVRKIAEVALQIAIQFKSLSRLEIHVKSGVFFGTLLELAENPHLKW